MAEEYYDRTYQSGRARLNDDVAAFVSRLSSGVAATFNAIHAIQFNAPWAAEQRRKARAGCA